MAKPKWDYDDEKFYKVLEGLGKLGATDKMIAATLDLDADTFSAMKNGTYIGWSESQNSQRSARILGVLARAREKSNVEVLNAYHALATGKAKSVTRRAIEMPCPDCNGDDVNCLTCGGTGRVASRKFVVQETTLPANLQAASTWLHHHCREWNESEKADNGFDEGSIPIENWLKDNTEAI